MPTVPAATTITAGRPGRRPALPAATGELPFALVVALCTVLLAGCSPEPRADLVIHNGSEIETLDPHVLTGMPDGRVSGSLFEGLTRFDPRTGRAMPGLASHWEVSADGRRYTFHLRTNAAFSTGEPIHADDFVWSWRRAVDPATAADYSGFFFYVEGGQALATGASTNLAELGIQAVDPHTVTVDLVNPTPFFPDLCAMRIMAVVPRRTIEEHEDQWVRASPLPCSGPYELVSWRPNDRIRVRRNPFHWDAAAVGCDRVDFLAGDSPAAALNLYLTGDIDFLIDKVVIPTELGDVLVRRPDFHAYAYLATYFLRFNVTRKPFDDPRVRKAIGLVVDRRRITERITRMGERPASALTPPGTGGYEPPAGLGHAAVAAPDPAAQATAMAEAVAEAQRLLAEAGYPGGNGFPPFTYMYNAGGGGGALLHENIGVELQTRLREHLGLRVELRPVEWKTYLSEMSRLNYDMIRGSWVGDYQDPTTFLDCFLSDSGNNRTGWRNERYDALLASAAGEADPEIRFDRLREAETLLVRDEVPLLPLYTYVGLFAYDPEKWEGIHENLTDQHPVWAIRRRQAAANPSAP
ncbi:MAG: peptide ABC transporter substrate-binding protein [Verrucomicrobiae bacterium]|nr:peptide ABC transporter substrate-binding protein [Verrucomicrobiae bacterium]